MFGKKPEFIAATCPKCGGKLELDVNFEVAYCADCGTQCIIKNVKKKVKQTTLDKIIELADKQNHTRRQDAQEAERLRLEREKLRKEEREKKKIERNEWWSKHWLKVVIIGLIVFTISLIYDYMMTH